jgi:hypothetical protein
VNNGHRSILEFRGIWRCPFACPGRLCRCTENLWARQHIRIGLIGGVGDDMDDLIAVMFEDRQDTVQRFGGNAAPATCAAAIVALAPFLQFT